MALIKIIETEVQPKEVRFDLNGEKMWFVFDNGQASEYVDDFSKAGITSAEKVVLANIFARVWKYLSASEEKTDDICTEFETVLTKAVVVEPVVVEPVVVEPVVEEK